MSSESVSSEDCVGDEQLVGLLRKPKMEARMEHQTHKRYQFLYYSATVLGAVLFIMVLLWCEIYRGGFAWMTKPDLQFNWHPLLMVTGMILLFSQSMLIYRTGRENAKKTLKLWHAIVHFGAFICAVIGLKAVFDFHNNSTPPKPNLYTLHSWLGLICVIIFAIQFLVGFCTFLLPIVGLEIKRITLPVHVAVGTCTFVLAVVVSMMGLTEKAIFAIKDYAQYPSEGFMVNFIGVVLMVYGLLAMFLVNEPAFKRQPLPEEEVQLVEHHTE